MTVANTQHFCRSLGGLCQLRLGHGCLTTVMRGGLAALCGPLVFNLSLTDLPPPLG